MAEVSTSTFYLGVDAREEHRSLALRARERRYPSRRDYPVQIGVEIRYNDLSPSAP